MIARSDRARRAAPSGRSRRPRSLRAILVSLRPRQWVKNLFVFAGLVFAQRLFSPAVWAALAAFAVFCALSGAMYLLNDVADRERDRLHPVKRHAAHRLRRALPVGARGDAWPCVLLAVGLGAAWLASRPAFALAALAYVVLLGSYSAWLKHVVIADVLAVAIGFVLRAVAGALAIEVAISGWLIICTPADRALPGPRQAPPRVHHPGGEAAAATGRSWPSTAPGCSTR